MSDKEITRQSGILNLLEEGAEVMADKGFLIGDLLKKVNATLVIPPFLGKTKGSDVSGGKQFTASVISNTQQIARLRIHVERATSHTLTEFSPLSWVVQLIKSGVFAVFLQI